MFRMWPYFYAVLQVLAIRANFMHNSHFCVKIDKNRQKWGFFAIFSKKVEKWSKMTPRDPPGPIFLRKIAKSRFFDHIKSEGNFSSDFIWSKIFFIYGSRPAYHGRMKIRVFSQRQLYGRKTAIFGNSRFSPDFGGV